MGRRDERLGLKFTGNGVSGDARRVANGERRREPAWSHQRDLTAAIGKRINLGFPGVAGLLEARLIAADQFTVKVRCEDDSGVSRTVTYFKSALAGFEVVE